MYTKWTSYDIDNKCLVSHILSQNIEPQCTCNKIEGRYFNPTIKLKNYFGTTV